MRRRGTARQRRLGRTKAPQAQRRRIRAATLRADLWREWQGRIRDAAWPQRWVRPNADGCWDTPNMVSIDGGPAVQWPPACSADARPQQAGDGLDIVWFDEVPSWP
jgi:hypothetical protein